MATITKLPNGRFKAIIRDRQRVLKTKTFTRRTDAKQWALGIEADRERLAALGEPGMRTTLSEYIPQYMKAWDGNDAARRPQLLWWTKALGDSPLSEISTDDVRRALDRYAEGKAERPNRRSKGKVETVTTNRPRTPATVNRMKAALSSLYKRAIADGIVRRNPVSGIPARAERNARTRWLSDTERADLIKATRESAWDKLYLLVLMALMTGARRGELLGLRWEQIDFAARTATLPKTKNGNPRTLSFPKPVIEELLRHRKAGGLVFARGNPFRAATITHPWKKALCAAKVEGFRFHDLRHSAASYLAMSGASLLEVADVLGHRSLQTTKRYAHLSTAHKQALTDRVLGDIMSA